MVIYISGAFSKTRFFASNTYALFSTHSEWKVHIYADYMQIM